MANLSFQSQNCDITLAQGLEEYRAYLRTNGKKQLIDEPDSTNSLVGTNTRREYTWGVNYFIAGHGNKITADYSYLTLDDNNPSKSFNDSRFRLQWDISF